MNVHENSSSQNMAAANKYGMSVCVNADVLKENPKKAVQNEQHGMKRHAVAVASLAVQNKVAAANWFGMKRLVLAFVQNILNTQHMDVQDQNFGMTRTANVNVRLVYQKAVVDHHKDGLTLNVVANVIQECHEVAVQEIKTGPKMLALAYVQRRFHQEDVQAVRNGMRPSVNADALIHQEKVDVQEIKDGMTSYADAYVNHQHQKVDVLEIKGM